MSAKRRSYKIQIIYTGINVTKETQFSFRVHKEKVKYLEKCPGRKMQEHLLQNEIEIKEKQVELHHDKNSSALQPLAETVGWLDLQSLKHLVSKRVIRSSFATNITHARKLSALGARTSLASRKPESVISITLPTLLLTDTISVIIWLSFSRPMYKPNFIWHYLQFEKNALSLKD